MLSSRVSVAGLRLLPIEGSAGCVVSGRIQGTFVPITGRSDESCSLCLNCGNSIHYTPCGPEFPCVKQRRPAWPFPAENSGVWVQWLSLVHPCSYTVPQEHPQDLSVPFVHRRFLCWSHCAPFCCGNSQLWLLRSKSLPKGSLSWQWSLGPLTPASLCVVTECVQSTALISVPSHVHLWTWCPSLPRWRTVVSSVRAVSKVETWN